MAKTAAGFTAVDAASASCTLARKLIPTVDRLRDLYTQFGLRPYTIRIIKTRWSGGLRGRGVEEITFERILDPTPLVTDIGGVAEIVTPIGLNESGTIRVAQISGRFTEDMLRGHDSIGTPPSLDEQVFYEVEFPNPGNGDSFRRRFTLRAVPMYFASRFEWVISLEKQDEDRARNGELR